ncbi:Ribosomal protein S19e [mine drainage metagenome]|uniref:Ribosomal protein S19e n=1 Tax=mine drainage metagenome TaxID=410659 RepID=T1C3G5_9ZZZZ
MANVYEVNPQELVKATAAKLKEVIKEPPEYVHFVKSGAGRERPPQDVDFWYVRSASVLRQVYLNGPIGVSRLRVRYGNKKEHVVHRKHFTRAGGSVITDSLKALEAAGLVKTDTKGRTITPKGKSFLDKLSNTILTSEGGQ